MRRKILIGVLSMMLLLLPACGMETDRDTSLETQAIEKQNPGGNAAAGEDADSEIPIGEGSLAEAGSTGARAGEGTEDGKGAAAGEGAKNGEGTAAGEGAKNGEGTAAGEGARDGEGTGTGESPEEPGNQISGDGGMSDAYRKVYSRILEEDGEKGNATVYSLAYVDSDDVPELIVWDRGYGIYSIYTVKDGEAFCMMDSVTTVELTYFEKNGIVAMFARWMGGGDEGGYGWYYYQVTEDKTITDDDVPVLHYSYEATYDDEGNWSGGGVTRYYHLGQEVDEAAYQEMASDLGIVEDDRKLCADNAMEKKEMMEFLAQ